MWEPAFNIWGLSNAWKVIVLAKASCQPWPDLQQEYFDNSAFPACALFQSKVRAYIDSTHPNVVVAAGSAPEVPTPSVARAKFDVANFVSSISASKAEILIVSPSPTFYSYDYVHHTTLSAPTCLALHAQQLQDCNQISLKLLLSTWMNPAINESPLPDKSKLLNLNQLLCDKKCPMIADGILIYIDNDHVSYDWAVHVSSALGQLLAPILKSN